MKNPVNFLQWINNISRWWRRRALRKKSICENWDRLRQRFGPFTFFK